MTAASDHFIFKNKLVVTGEAGSASVVVIFGLEERKMLDWFFCWEARRVSESWIASVEWYPNHGMRWPTDVVLIYDLDRTPSANRPGNASPTPIPPPPSALPLQVGFPVYPQSNADDGSYLNVVPDAESAIHLLGTAHFTLLPSRWLVFVAGQGKDFASSWNYLAVVDLSSGLLRPPARSLDIPKGPLQRLGKNPRVIQVDRIEAVGDHSVRLFFPKPEYGVDSEVVDLVTGKVE